MKAFLFFMFSIICSNYTYSQIDVSSKIYITQNEYYIPFVQEKHIALIYKGGIESLVDREESVYVLWLALSNKYDYKIKYSLTNQNYLIALSLFSESFKTHNHSLNQKVPLFVTITLAKLENIKKKSIENFLNNRGITGPDVESLSLLDNFPMRQYTNEKISTTLILHDFASSKKELYLTNKISDTLQVWKYEIDNKNIQLLNNTSLSGIQKISPQLINSYGWTLEENFYTCYIKNQLFLFTESGYIFRLGETAEKVGKLPDNLIDSAIVVDKDHDRLYFFKKSHIKEGLTFAGILKRYAQEIKLPGK